MEGPTDIREFKLQAQREKDELNQRIYGLTVKNEELLKELKLA